jgi:polynucleotide 5'-kinase involved in rRNA processing
LSFFGSSPVLTRTKGNQEREWKLRLERKKERERKCVKRLQLDRSTALYIYKAKICKLLVFSTRAQKTKFIFKKYIKTLFSKDLFLIMNY